MAKIKPFKLIPDEVDVMTAVERAEAAKKALDRLASTFRKMAIAFEEARQAVERFSEVSINVGIDDSDEGGNTIVNILNIGSDNVDEEEL